MRKCRTKMVVPQHNDQCVRPDRDRLARLPARDTSCAFDARDQGVHQRGIAHEVLIARTDFCFLSDAPPEHAEECHADQRCAPRLGARRQRCLAYACEEKSVVIMNTPGQNVNAVAELVFDIC